MQKISHFECWQICIITNIGHQNTGYNYNNTNSKVVFTSCELTSTMDKQRELDDHWFETDLAKW